MRVTHGLRRSLQINAAGVATIDGDRRRTWREVGERVARAAGALRRMGVGKGHRVAILSLNSDRYFELYLAIAWAGAVVVPLNIRWSLAENEYALRDCRALVLVIDQTFARTGASLAASIPGLKLVYADEEDGASEFQNYDAMIASSEPIEDAMAHRDELAGIFYTGGTTGRAKGVMLSHGNLMANALNALAEGLLSTSAVYLHAAPMFHLANGTAMYALFLCGGTSVFVKSFNPEAVMAAIEREKVTNTVLVPTMIQMLVDHPSLATRDLSSLTRISYGGSPISEALIDRTIAKLPGTELQQGYGMTELSPLATVLQWKEHVGEGRAKGRHRSGGRAMLGCEVRIVDENGRPVSPRAVGEIVARGDNVMMGYWGQLEETARAVVDGWMHTGDAGYMDEEGFIYIVDRFKDMILTGGENVYSFEVENIVAQHPAVAQCAVIGIPSEQWGEQVHAFVVKRADVQVTEEEIIDFCKERIAGYKCPRSVEFSRVSLPLSGAGKILKRELRRPFWEDHGRRFG